MNSLRLSLGVGLILVVILIFGFMPDQPVSESTSPASENIEDTVEAQTDSPGLESQTDTAVVANSEDAETHSEAQNHSPTPQIIDINGRVSDETGQPIEYVLVSDESQFGSARTDANGRYRITIEMPKFKSPFLNFLRTGYRENRVGVALEEITAEATLELDVSLQQAVNSTTVQGWVGNALGAGLSGRKIELRSKNFDRSGIIFYAVLSDANGDFTFEGIRSDLEYRLDIAPDEDYAGFNLEPFWVSHNTPRTVIVLDTLRLVNVDGMIVDTDNAPVANFSINLQNLSVDYPDRKISSDSSGFFKLEGFPAGEIKLSTNAPEYFKITGLTLRENDYRNLTLVIDKGGYHLSGWIGDNNGSPLAEARVTLNSAFVKDGYHSYSYRSTLTDDNGGFQFSRLGGQNHTISVYAKGFATHIEPHRFASFSDSLTISLERVRD